MVSAISPGTGARQTLTVIHVAELFSSNPKTLRVMRDPNLPVGCPGGGTAAFTKDAMLVRDLNGDGYADVTVGWSSRCGSKGAKSEVKLAVISNGKKYIIRGRGVIGSSSGTTAPDPGTSHWPATYLSTADHLFHKLYY